MVQRAVQGVVVILAVYTMVQAVMLRTIPKVRFYILLAVAACFYAFGHFLELGVHSTEAALVATRVQYCGISVYAAFFYLFVRDYGDRPVRKKSGVVALLAYPVAIVSLVFGYPRLPGYFIALGFSVVPAPHLVARRGPWFVGLIVHSFVLAVLCAIEVLRRYPGATREDRVRRLLFLVAAFTPCAALALYALEESLPMELGSAAMVISLIAMGWYILRFRARDWRLNSREQVIENLGDGYVLFDAEGRFIDANGLAYQYFPELERAEPDAPASDIDGLPAALWQLEDGTADLELPQGLALRASASPILSGGRRIGTCVLLYDITELRDTLDDLRKRASRDSLTGLNNRETFMRLARRDFRVHARAGLAWAFVMLDIDHFKRVNDTYGHQMGDKVLQGVAAAFDARLRRTDISGRYGGEEFCAFLPGTDCAGARLMAEDVRRAIGALSFDPGGSRYGVTISAGVCAFDPGRHRRLEDVIAEADAALYRAKAEGRNRVVASGRARACDIALAKEEALG